MEEAGDEPDDGAADGGGLAEPDEEASLPVAPASGAGGASAAKAKAPAAEEFEEAFSPKKRRSGPSAYMRVAPSNLDEAKHRFFASDCSEAPMFEYSYTDDEIDAYFAETSAVDFDLLPEAQLILQLMYEGYSSPEGFNAKFYGSEHLDAEFLKDAIKAYVDDLNVSDRCTICIVDQLMSAACVNKLGYESKYLIKLKNSKCSAASIQGICDHEVGTHLLRMINDESQTWHRCRDRYNLANPWITEEGLATLNTYISLPLKLLYPQALGYFAACRAANIGFVQLFNELRSHFVDPEKCWTLCCRVKRGMRDTSKPGAQYVGQAYFKGCVDILRSLDGLDFSLLYSGQIALQDLKRASHLIRRDNVRLPRFLGNERRYRSYWQHCLEMLHVNRLDKPAFGISRSPSAPRLSAGRKVETRRQKCLEPGGASKRNHSSMPPRLSRTLDGGSFAHASPLPTSDPTATALASSAAKASLSRTLADASCGTTSQPSLSQPTAVKRSVSASAAAPAAAKARAKSAARKARPKKRAAFAEGSAAASPAPTPSPSEQEQVAKQPSFFSRPSVGSWVGRSKSHEEEGDVGHAAEDTTDDGSPPPPPPPPPASGLPDFAAKHRSKCRVLQVVQERRFMAMHDASAASMCDCCG